MNFPIVGGLGSVTSAIQEMSTSDQELLRKMKAVEKFISRYRLSSDMAKRLKESTKLHEEWNTDMFSEIFHACHPEFRSELLMAIHRPILVKTSFFRGIDEAFMKLIVDVDTDKVVGCHMVGPDSAEIMQGIGIALKCGAAKAQFDSTVGIHPSSAEEFVTMRDPTRRVGAKAPVEAKM